MIATKARADVAISATDPREASRYAWTMFSDWIRAALKHAKMSQAELARQLAAWRPGIERSVVNKVAMGKRKLSAEELFEVARITGYPPPPIPADEIVDEEQDGNTIPLIGFVGAGAVLVDFEPAGVLERIPMVEGANENTRALGIRGQSLGDTFDNWIVLYDDVLDEITSAMVGKLCVVGLLDGRQVVKTVKPGRDPGTYDLFGNFGDPIYDAEVEWAAVVRTMVQRQS